MTKEFILIIILIAAAILFNNFVVNKPVQNVTNRLVAKSSGWLVAKSHAVSSLKQKFANNNKLALENQELKKTVAELTGQLVNYDTLERENKFLRRQLGVIPSRAEQLLAGKVLDVRKNSLGSTILIDRGSLDGISSGMTVIAAGNIFVGTVMEAYDKSSLVLLADDPRQNVNVRIRGTNILGRTEGVLDSMFRINLVDRLEDIAVGADVISAGLGGVPESLVVGRIELAEEAKDRRLFKNIFGKALFNLSLSSDVFVIIQ